VLVATAFMAEARTPGDGVRARSKRPAAKRIAIEVHRATRVVSLGGDG
jgi:hypothetical protein